MIKLPFLRGFRWYRKLAGGQWRIVNRSGNQLWIPKAEVRKGEKRYGKRTYPEKPWSMKVEPAPDQQTPSPAPDPEQPVPSLAT